MCTLTRVGPRMGRTLEAVAPVWGFKIATPQNIIRIIMMIMI